MSALPLPPARVLRWGAPLLLALAVLPWVVEPYQTTLFSYGLVMAIAALGFNLLLGYTGLLSFGHSAYFGVGAYAVALIVKYLKVSSLEILIVGGILASAAISALFGFLCVRYTKIFFGILTLALSQVLWSLAFKFFWVTGGTDGLQGVVIGPLLDKGLLKRPLQFSFIMGVLGGIRATAENLALQAREAPDDSTWEVIGISHEQWRMVAAALSLGGNVRVGLEDNFYLDTRGEEMARSNGELVAKAVRMARDIGREPATVAEAREILSLGNVW